MVVINDTARYNVIIDVFVYINCLSKYKVMLFQGLAINANLNALQSFGLRPDYWD